jgi:GR25 family glycosyltransferase involved in LPS biosynthesis
MELSGVGLYFINLKEREDRLESFTSQFLLSDLSIQRVEAISSSEVKPNNSAPVGVIACWRSHQKVYELLLESQNTHAVVFEDDALVTRELLEWLEGITSSNFRGIDLFQIGYLKSKRISLHHVEFDPAPFNTLNLEKYIGCGLARIDFIYRNWIRFSRSFLLVILTAASKSEIDLNSKLGNRFDNFKNYFSNERRVRTQLQVKNPLIYHSFEAGAHAYVISREFASVMGTFNSPVFLPADLCFMGIARGKNFKILRTSKSMCSQANSTSSIGVRTNV